VLRLPQIVSHQEVARLIDAAETLFHRILLMNLYATGARRVNVPSYRLEQARHNVQTVDQPTSEPSPSESVSGSGLRPSPPARLPERHEARIPVAVTCPCMHRGSNSTESLWAWFDIHLD
jgi:hypothetical protein